MNTYNMYDVLPRTLEHDAHDVHGIMRREFQEGFDLIDQSLVALTTRIEPTECATCNSAILISFLSAVIGTCIRIARRHGDNVELSVSQVAALIGTHRAELTPDELLDRLSIHEQTPKPTGASS